MSAALTTLVRSILSRPEVAKIDFTLGGVRVAKSSFGVVKEAIKDGKIDVVYKASQGKNTAKYRYTENKLFLGFRASGATADNEALVVHEAVHMICDLAALPIKTDLDEAAAYVAQCLYFFYQNEEALSKPGRTPTFTNPVLKEAWVVAMAAREKKVVDDEDIKKLLKAISEYHLYSTTHSVVRIYNG